MFKSFSRMELKKLEHESSETEVSSYDEEVDVDAISYNNNQNVEYLLVGVGMIFDMLIMYDASNCAVREIFWNNFVFFRILESINLANNQIAALTGDLLPKIPLKNLDLCKYTNCSTRLQNKIISSGLLGNIFKISFLSCYATQSFSKSCFKSVIPIGCTEEP